MKNLILALTFLLLSATIAEAQQRRSYNYNYSRPSITYGNGYPRNYRLYNSWSVPYYSGYNYLQYRRPYTLYNNYYLYSPYYYNYQWIQASPQFR